MKLIEASDQIEAMGVNIATITYDSVELLNEVAQDEGIEFALLHDEAVSLVNAFGIRNLDYEPDHRVYGIPYPGIFIVDTQGVIQFKLAEEGYRTRPDFADILEAVSKM
ncbi:MAG: hypothetical protein COC19_00525 [SAR86 cluster bacterium]|uniref:Alkyl hydroperoxide reductase subunit C/ Thiol specific antioxidant domain-containing protein n=1 Tax=SAR86 cluster bacterium TaxID=2030880 RepID=A0A2A4MWE3_9GAMM|nr:MAG: hypothetical protein COC19_00525 [SAR86 cluster bacterium]